MKCWIKVAATTALLAVVSADLGLHVASAFAASEATNKKSHRASSSTAFGQRANGTGQRRQPYCSSLRRRRWRAQHSI
jgi:hypothetical protein